MFTNIIQEICSQFQESIPSKEAILMALFENEELKQKFANEIRRSTIIGQLANEIFKQLNINESCKIMAIGDIEYFGNLKNIWQDLMKKSLCEVNPEKLSFYDLTGLGSEKLREKLFEYMNIYYDFPDLKDKIKNEIIPCYGSTDGFVMLLDTLKQRYQQARFIFPETSFLANTKIAESYDFELISVPKPSFENFFLSKSQIDALYEKPSIQNIFYFTSVGNPTGEKIDGENIYEIIQHIVSKDDKAIIILDNVYVGLLQQSVSTQMFQKIFSNTQMMNQIIFCESLSKTLGTTGIRIGFLWTLNQEMSASLKRNIALKKAGFSKVLDEMVQNLLSDMNEIISFQNEVYEFISMQRIRFMQYIQAHFSEFFDFEKSSKVQEREGIYVLLKVKDGFSSQYIFAKTGIIGVEILLSDGKYIRYSFGNTNYF